MAAVCCGNSFEQVGCIHSIQGYDLNYGFVIIGEDIKYAEEKGGVYTDRKGYKDKYGKQQTSDEELERYIKNIYYVLLTRGIKGTYIYVCNKELREYFAKYIKAFNKANLSTIKIT